MPFCTWPSKVQDFSTLPDTLTLLPGQTADTLSFWVYDDNLVEGIDTLVIIQDYVYTSCYNYPVRRFPYYIRDKDTLLANLTSYLLRIRSVALAIR